MKKIISTSAFASLLFSTMVFTSCKDKNDEIKDDTEMTVTTEEELTTTASDTTYQTTETVEQ